jgi:Holliday junction resolvase
MRLRGKVDANHAQIVAALRKAGIAVKSLAAVGGGLPDLLTAFRRTTVLLEIKVPGEKPNAQQREFLETWPGHVYVVTSPEEAVRAVIEAARP